MLRAVDDREWQVLKMRFGICGEERRTLREVGSSLGVTGSRVSQIEARALRKLRGASTGCTLYRPGIRQQAPAEPDVEELTPLGEALRWALGIDDEEDALD